MDLGVYQLRNFSISFLSSLLGTDTAAPLTLDSRYILLSSLSACHLYGDRDTHRHVSSLSFSSSGASVVAIDNKIEQAMVGAERSECVCVMCPPPFPLCYWSDARSSLTRFPHRCY